MARVDNLENFLTDVAGAIKTKRGYQSSQTIEAEDFDTEISAINTGIDTSDATALVDDILSPKTAYVNGQKITGIIETQSVVTSDLSNDLGLSLLNTLTDYRQDLGLALACDNSGRQIYIYDIQSDGSVTSNNLIKTIDIDSSYFYVSNDKGSTILNNIKDCKFVIGDSSDSFVYIACAGVGTFNAGSSWGEPGHHWAFANVIVKLDLSNNLEVLTTFSCNYTSSFFLNVYGNAFGNGGTGIVPSGEYNFIVLSSGTKYNGGDIGTRANLIKIDTTNDTASRVAFNAVSNTDTMNGLVSENGRWVATFTSSSVSISLFNSSFISSTVKFSGNDFANYKPLLLNSYMYYKSNLYDAEGLVVETYNTCPFESEASYKFYCLNYVIEVYNDIAYVYKFDETNYTFDFIRMIPAGAFVSVSIGQANFRITNFPVSSKYGITFYNSTELTFSNYYAIESTRRIISIRRNGYYYTTLDGTNATQDKILSGYKAYSGNSLITGNMPNNGQLSYTPGDSAITIPLGYTSGGTISAVDITTLSDYTTCLNIVDDILGE